MRYFTAGFILVILGAAALGCLVLAAMHFAPDISKDNNALYVFGGGLLAVAAIIITIARLTQ